MPKPFLLGVEIEEAAFGRVMRKINALPGVVAIHMDLDRRGKPSSKPNGAAGKGSGRIYGESGAEVLTKALAGGKTMSTAQMRQLFESQGRSPKSLNSLTHNMQESGTLVKAGRGVWRLRKKG